ncbi:MAG TPA: VTT domain-containing protein [Terriglobales bacterium]|nr:VTT domain-containing protein [Terriglobales bacterium]
MFDLLLFAPRRRTTRSFASTLRHLGAAGLFFLAILDSSPLPTFGGPDILTVVLAASHRELWYEYAASATIGSVIGAYLTFRLARRAGSAYLDKKFKKSRVGKFLTLFKKWGTGTLAASTAIPLPTPTSLFFAAAGASDYPKGKFVGIVAACRALRYFGLAFIAATYGRRFLRVLRHPIQHWGWLIFFISATFALIIGGILMSRRLESTSAE